MMTARFVSWASLFALLIVDICCLPVKKGYPGAFYESRNTNTAPNVDLYRGVPSGQFSPKDGMFKNAPPQGVSTSTYQAVQQPGPSVPQLAAQRGPAPSVGSGSSGLAFSGYSGTSVRQNPDSSAQPGAASQPGPQDFQWGAAPPSLFSGGEEMSTGALGIVSSQPENVSPPEAMYQAGELSRYEQSLEHGNSEHETESLDWLPPRQGFTSQPQPDSNMGGSHIPYHYNDFLFLSGQYPPGTVSYVSNSFEQGRDSFQDVHYLRHYAPNNPGPAQQSQTSTGDFAAPQSIKDTRMPVVAGYGQGGAQAASSPRGFRQPIHRQAGGYNLGYVGYW